MKRNTVQKGIIFTSEKNLDTKVINKENLIVNYLVKGKRKKKMKKQERNKMHKELYQVTRACDQYNNMKALRRCLTHIKHII